MDKRKGEIEREKRGRERKMEVGRWNEGGGKGREGEKNGDWKKGKGERGKNGGREK